MLSFSHFLLKSLLVYFWLTEPPKRSHYRVSVHGEVRLVARLYRNLEHHCTGDSKAAPAIGLHYFGPKAREEVASTTALDLILTVLRRDQCLPYKIIFVALNTQKNN